jgi:hypothetical protein
MFALLTLAVFALQSDPTPAAAPVEAPKPLQKVATTLEIPARTAFVAPGAAAMKRKADGSVTDWPNPISWYGKLNATGDLNIQLNLLPEAPAGFYGLHVTAMNTKRGQRTRQASEGGESQISFEPISIEEAGYHRIDLWFRAEVPRPGIRSITLSGAAAKGAHFSLVERRNAASVHLGYPVPKKSQDNVEWFYCEVTPKTDPLWTYYEATGWHRGYFGMQVNSKKERRIIFSVWDSGNEAISRDKVQDENRVRLLAKGKGVVANDFGNEGTGGHSHLVYDWKLGDTFKFLLQAKAEGAFTTYTGWFYFPEKKAWGLIASFKAPHDGKLPHGLYSFNENFSGRNGQLQRVCEFHNQWVRTTAGEWIELKEARFTHDGTGKENRLDRSGGVRGDRFYLSNGGFVEDSNPTATTKAYDILTRAASKSKHPADKDLPSL